MDVRVRVPAPAQEERFKFCALSGGSINQDRCRVLSRVPSKNDVCTKNQCMSPWRLCATCVKEDGRSPSTVAKRGGRLCSLHEKNGQETQPSLQSPSSAPKPVAAPMKPKAVVELAAAAPAIVVEEILAAPEPPIAQALEPPEPEIVQELQRAAAVEDVVVPVLAKHFDIDLPPRRTLAEREKPAMRYASDEDVKEFAQNISRVKGNQRNTLEAVMEHGLEEGTKRLGLQPSSVTGYLSMAARIMGIPKPNRFHPYDRLDALRRAWAYFKLNPEACGSPEKVILRRGEWKLLESFRVMSSEDKMQFLKMAEVFASKSK